MLLALLVAVTISVASVTTNQRQVGGFTAQLPPQTTPSAAPSQVGHRHIHALPGVPITSRLEPGDTVVEVVRTGLPFIDVPNVDAEQELETLLNGSSAVAVIEVLNKESAFSTSQVGGPGEDWIRSTLTVEVREVLKDTTGQLVAGNLMEVRETGGEVVLPDGRRIIARSSYVRPSRVGGTYLAVLGFYEGRFSFGMFSVEFDNGQIKRMRLDAPPDTDLVQKTPDWAKQRARTSAAQRPQ
jgi:hypothetical protein